MSDDDRASLGVGSLVIDDPIYARGFVVLHKYILHARNVTAQAKILYCFLLSYAFQDEQCFPGYERLTGDTGWSENVVRKYMKELEEIGLVTVEQRGFMKTNLYHIARLESVRLSTSESEVHDPHILRVSPSDSEVYQEPGVKKKKGVTDLQRSTAKKAGAVDWARRHGLTGRD
jgi:hypothetical protein